MVAELRIRPQAMRLRTTIPGRAQNMYGWPSTRVVPNTVPKMSKRNTRKTVFQNSISRSRTNRRTIYVVRMSKRRIGITPFSGSGLQRATGQAEEHILQVWLAQQYIVHSVTPVC